MTTPADRYVARLAKGVLWRVILEDFTGEFIRSYPAARREYAIQYALNDIDARMERYTHPNDQEAIQAERRAVEKLVRTGL